MTIHAQANCKLTTKPAKTSLLGGHFIYRVDTTQGTLTPSSANIIQNVSVNGQDVTNNPAQWGYNTHIGANGIKLRNNEVTLSEWLANGLKIYNPIITNGVITDSKLGMTIGSDGVKFYKNEDSSNPIARFSDEGMFISPTTDFSEPRGFIIQKNAEYVLSTDTTVNVNKTYYTYSNNTYTEVANPSGNPSTQHYYEFNDYSINIFHKKITNDGPAAIATNNSFAWGEGKIRVNTAAMTGVDEQGNPVANSASIDAYYPTIATGRFSFAQGRGAEASGDYSVALGTCVKATQEGQLAIGQYSKVDNDALFIIGNGDELISTLNGDFISGDRNLFVVKKNGNLEVVDGFKIVDKDELTTYLQLSNTGLDIVKNGTTIAQYGSDIIIGNNSLNHLEITNQEINVLNGTSSLANFGSNVRIGQSEGNHLEIVNNEVKILNNTKVLAKYGAETFIGPEDNYHIEITPGTPDDPNELAMLKFVSKTGEVVAFMSNEELNIPRVVVLDSMKVGKWKWDGKSDPNHLTLRWNG